MLLTSLFEKFTSNSLIHSVSVLVGGTALSQAITLLALPFITRLYTPDDFSLLAVYAAMLIILSVAACLRFDIAIPMPETDEGAINLLAVAMLSSIIISILVAIPFLIMPEVISSLLNQPDLATYLWLVPLGVFFGSSYSALQYWATRKKEFSVIAKTRIGQSLGGAGTQLTFGWFGMTPIGLILGQMISHGAGIFSLGYLVVVEHRKLLKYISWQLMWEQICRYDRFPKYSTLDALANSSGIQLPIILIAALAVGPEAGFIMLAMRVMQAPMGLIGSAVSQVYLSHAPDERRNGNLPGFTSKILSGLMKTGVGPLVFMGFLAPVVFPLIFGDEWKRAGELVSWMTPWFIMQFMVSPISMVMHICDRQRLMLLITVGGLCLRLGSIVGAHSYFPHYVSEAFALSSAAFYIVCFFIFSRTAGLAINEYRKIIRPSLVILVGWLVAAISTYVFIDSLS